MSDEEAQAREPEIELPPESPGQEPTVNNDPTEVDKPNIPSINLEDADYLEPCYCPITKKVMVDPVVWGTRFPSSA